MPAGRCVVLEGPSRIGKTSTVTKIIEDLSNQTTVLKLSARNRNDIEMINALPEMGDLGTVIVDDFHRLDEKVKRRLSDFAKILADEGSLQSKLILVGINHAGSQLIDFAPDLTLRLDIFRIESNPSEKVSELIEKGEDALNIKIRDRNAIVDVSNGSFHIAQVLCHNLCLEAKISDTQISNTIIDVSANVIIDRVVQSLSQQFRVACIEFAKGSKIRREGRAPYLHILKWLSESREWSLDLNQAIRSNPTHKASIGQVIEKGFLEKLLEEKQDILGPVFNYQPLNRVISVEDPKLVFFLRNIGWRNFSKEVGFSVDYFNGQYDFALSFAGANRGIAEKIFNLLSDRQVSVFYDMNEQYRIIAQDVEDYLRPIYATEANYILPILSKDYPSRIWTKFESDAFKVRFGDNAVIPIRFSDYEPGFFSEEQKYGGLTIDPTNSVEKQLINIVEILCKRLEHDRRSTEDIIN